MSVHCCYFGFQNLPQTSVNNLEMHKLFIKAAFENTVHPGISCSAEITALHLRDVVLLFSLFKLR